MRTAEAVTEAEGIWFAFAGVLLLYAALGTGAILVLRAMSRRWREEGEAPRPAPPTGPPRGTPIAGGDRRRDARRDRRRR